jgi:DNA-binding transcriptional ArsR family regulator
MTSSEDDMYSAIFASLKHPLRRKILRILSAGPQNFSEMQKTFGIESSHLTYHLEGLGELLLKTKDGKYALSSVGDAAVSMMNRVEEPPRHPLRLRFSSKKWKFFATVLVVALILLSSSLFYEYQSLRQLSTQYSSLKEEHELMLDILRQALGLENSSLTQRYNGNNTVATSLVESGVLNYTPWFWYPYNVPDESIYTNITVTYTNITTPWGDNIVTYSIFNLANNSTLKMEFSLLDRDQHQCSLSVELWEYVTMNDEWSSWTSVDNCNGLPIYPTRVLVWQTIWQTNVTKSTSYSVSLPSCGRFLIRVEAPSVENATDHYDTSYAITLQVEHQGKNTPFFVESQTEGSSMLYFALDYDSIYQMGIYQMGRDPIRVEAPSLSRPTS